MLRQNKKTIQIRMSGYTIYPAAQAPSTVPVVIGNTLAPVANYVNRDTPYWLREGNPVVDTSAVIINNVDNTITNITSFNPNNTFDNVMVDTPGSGNSVVIYTLTPQGPRPYTQWITNFSGDVFAPNLLNTITNFTTLSFSMGSSPYPANPAQGIIVGEVFNVPKSGVYLFEATLSLNVNPQPVVVGPSDFVQMGLIVDDTPPIIGASVPLKPWDMPGDITGQDYAVKSSATFTLVQGTAYNLFWCAFNLGGTLNLGDANGGGQLRIIQLC
jgi:hypothetical protein